MKSRSVALPILALASAVTAFAVESTAGYHLLKTMPLDGDGNQDYLAIDQPMLRH